MRHLIWVGLLGVAFAAVAPKPPGALCIGDDPADCVSSEQGVKWHPGHYMLTPSVNDYSAAHVTALKGEPYVQGIQHRVYWAALEPSPGQYDFRLIELLLALCETNGKWLVLQLMDRRFGDFSSGIVPPGIPLIAVNGGYRAPVWQSDSADRYIALIEALGRRFDREPYFEALVIPETSAPSPVPAGYSKAAHAEQLKRVMSRAHKAWPHTLTILYTNYLTDQVTGLYAHLRSIGAGAGGPDVLPPPHGDTTGSRVLQGIEGGQDYRSLLPIGYAVQGPELCGKEGCYTPDKLFAHAVDTLRVTHLFWLRFGAQKGEAYSWESMLRTIRAEQGRINGACPQNLICR